ncbi:MAG: polyprenyl synthetase family protein [Gammaproteobacteria bacterium]|nr:polyprenyl synthetase family protein [Gammaproteobacteria bacterium]
MTKTLCRIKQIESWKERVRGLCLQYIHQKLKDSPQAWLDRVIYPLKNEGKNIRALFCYSIGHALNIPLVALDPLAVAIELLHTYTLVHDDLPAMDNDDFRRGKLSAHRRFNEADAILIGDALLTEALAHLVRHSFWPAHVQVQIIKLFTDCIGADRLILGQWIDLSIEPNSYDGLCQMYRYKTGELFRFSCLGPALITNSISEQDWLSCLGLDLGLAFQIQDDLQDDLPMSVIGRMGQSDRKNDKKTILHYKSRVDAERLVIDLYEKHIAVIDQRDKSERWEFLLDLLKKSCAKTKGIS